MNTVEDKSLILQSSYGRPDTVCDRSFSNVGCAISGNPQNSGVFEFTRQQCDGHLMTASGPEVVSRLTEGKGQKAETMGATAPLGHADRDREAS